MSACSKIVVKERGILSILRDFFEETERFECLVTFERYTGAYPRHLPRELVPLREAVLQGNLDELQKNISDLFRNKGDASKLKKCEYELAKQQYLEMLLTLSKETADALKQKLLEVEELCPSSEEFDTLLSLLSLPSLKDSPEYRGWTVQGGRLKCFYQLVDWLVGTDGLQAKSSSSSCCVDSPPPNLSECRLVQLLAKGLLYEQCEAVCAHSQQAGSKRKSTTGILDLYNWIKQQPDSAFQLSPSVLQLDIQTESRDDSGRSCASDGLKDAVFSESDSDHQLKTSPTPEHTDNHTRDIEKIEACSAVAEDVNQHDSDSAPDGNQTDNDCVDSSRRSNPEDSSISPEEREQASSSPHQPVGHWLTEDMMKFDDNFVDLPSQRINETTNLLPSRSEIGLSLSQKVEVLPSSTSAPALQVKLENKVIATATHKVKEKTHLNASNSENGLSQVPNEEAPTSSTSMPALSVKRAEAALKLESQPTTVQDSSPLHHLKKGRKSSTPKPKHIVQPPSPCSSPVPHIPAIRVDPTEGRFSSKAKKQIDFNENDESIIFPSAKLLAHIKDKQVVRSVAFSESGRVVAIGANSRTLRLCSTQVLLEESSSRYDEHIPVFYCANNYHKGSVYCMAWWRDSLLVSGSNDQSIRLLSFNPTSQPSPCNYLGQMKIHNGTVRDVAFTLDGLLVSGGVGDNIIKVSNPETSQIVNTLYGHYDQILGLFVVNENVLASASQDKTVKLWDLRLGQSFGTLDHPDSVASVAASAHLSQLASAQLDGSCMIHDFRTLRPLSMFNAHTDECRTVRYSICDQGRWLLTSSYDGTVCLADTKTFEWQQVAEHKGKVVQCRWHNTLPLFASTGADNQARFWRLDL